MSGQSFCMSLDVEQPVADLDVEQPEADLEVVYAGGPPGLAATIAVGGVQTLEPGAAATVENVGTPNAAVFSFGIPKGDKGDPGESASSYDFTQASPSDTWTIAHNFGFRPSVSIASVGGVEMDGTVTHLSTDVLQISFNIPVAGSARLN